jgi:hypothetical protein
MLQSQFSLAQLKSVSTRTYSVPRRSICNLHLRPGIAAGGAQSANVVDVIHPPHDLAKDDVAVVEAGGAPDTDDKLNCDPSAW